MSKQKKKMKLIKRIVGASVFGLSLIVFAAPVFAQTDASVQALKNTTTAPERLSASFAEVAKIVEPAVVNIESKGKVPEIAAKGEPPASQDPEDIMEFLRKQSRRPSKAVGSGFIVDKAGYLLTNLHVIEDASRITVKLDSGEEYTAKIIGTDEETDLAVLKIDAGRDLPFVKLADSDKTQVGDWVLAIGSPFGLARTVTAGIISQTRRETPYASVFQKFIQTDAAINRGNSGGPLVDMNGEVVGVNSQIATSTGDYNGIGFALPANEAANVYRQILSGGKVRRGYLGIVPDSVKPEFAKVYKLDDAGGAIITQIPDPASSAAKAGLKTGDIVVEINGQKIAGAPDLIARVAAVKPDETINITYLRENGDALERKTASVKLAERPSRNRAPGEADPPQKMPIGAAKEEIKPFGLTLTELTPQIAAANKYDGQKGLFVKEINPASYLADVQTSNGSDALDEGDLIQRINRVTVSDLKTFNEFAKNLKPGDPVVLQVLAKRAGREPVLKIVQFTVQ